jgi:hypothetical protein
VIEMFGLTKEQDTIVAVVGVTAIMGWLWYRTNEAQKKADAAHAAAAQAVAHAAAQHAAAEQAQAAAAAAAAQSFDQLQQLQAQYQAQYAQAKAELDALTKQLPATVLPTPPPTAI